MYIFIKYSDFYRSAIFTQEIFQLEERMQKNGVKNSTSIYFYAPVTQIILCKVAKYPHVLRQNKNICLFLKF